MKNCLALLPFPLFSHPLKKQLLPPSYVEIILFLHLLKLTSEELKSNFARYNQRAIAAVRGLQDLDRLVHLTYGDFPAREYLQQNVAARAFWSYDIAKLIGADFTLADDFVQALTEEFTPVVESYRQLGLFPPEVKVGSSASPQTKLLALVGRD